MAGTLTYPPASTYNPIWPKDARGLSMRTLATYAGPGSGAGGYVTGGDPITAQQVKLGLIEWSPPAIGNSGTAAVVYQYNFLTGKIQAFWQTGAGGAAALPEVDSGTDLSTYVALMSFEGRG